MGKVYTVKEVSKKLKVSEGHIYDLIKKGKLEKVNDLGRVIRISSESIKNLSYKRIDDTRFRGYENKIELVETHLGVVRKVIENGWYILKDISMVIGINNTHTIKERASENNTKLLQRDEIKKLGIEAFNAGLTLITLEGLQEYSKKSKSQIDWVRFLKELRNKSEVKNIKEEIQQTFEEQITEQAKATENNQLQIFNNPEFGEIRWIKINGKDYAVGKDVAKCLGYSNPRDAIIRHCKGVVKHDGFKEGGQCIALIPEGDIYRLVANSKLPGAD